MVAYKFRVTFEDHDDVSRDIEIRSVQTFEDLHKAILNAVGFDANHDGSFFMSDDNWKKGQEIATQEKVIEKRNGEVIKVPSMKKCRLCDYIIDPHQKIYYIYDPKSEWGFYVELVKIVQDSASISYPRVVKSSGVPPKQYGASNLGKAPTEFDFFNESGIDTEEEGDGQEQEAISEEGEGGELENEVDEFGMEDDYKEEEH